MSHDCVPIYDIHSDVCYYKCVRLVASCCCVCSRLMNNCALATKCREKLDLYCATIWRRGPPRISTGISHTGPEAFRSASVGDAIGNLKLEVPD